MDIRSSLKGFSMNHLFTVWCILSNWILLPHKMFIFRYYVLTVIKNGCSKALFQGTFDDEVDYWMGNNLL